MNVHLLLAKHIKKPIEILSYLEDMLRRKNLRKIMELKMVIIQALLGTGIGYCLGLIYGLRKEIKLLNQKIEYLDKRIDEVYTHLEQFYDE